MKILVTGGSGFIANHLIDHLISNYNHSIIVTSRSDKNIRNRNWFDKVKFIEADLYSNNSNWFDFFNKPDLLIHLAWENLPNYTQDFHLTRNLPNEISFLNNILTNGLKSLTMVGTCFEYGIQNGELSEDFNVNPSNPYAIAKDTLRRYLQFKVIESDIKFRWLRLFYLFGFGQGENSIIPQLDAAVKKHDSLFNMSGGEQIRDYLPVELVAEYIVKLSLIDKSIGIVNICSGKPIKILDFINNYISKNKLKIKLNLGHYKYSDLEPMEFWGSNKKLIKLLKSDES